MTTFNTFIRNRKAFAFIKLAVLILLIGYGSNVSAQSILVFNTSGVDNCMNPTPNMGTYTKSGTANGKDLFVKGANLRIRWNNTRWELQGDDPAISSVDWITGWYNTSNTTRPPATCWQPAFGCFPIAMSGTGVSTDVLDVANISAPDASIDYPADNDTVNFVVTFSAAINNLSASNFSLDLSGNLTGVNIVSATQTSSTVWKVKVAVGAGTDGSVDIILNNVTGTGKTLCTSPVYSSNYGATYYVIPPYISASTSSLTAFTTTYGTASANKTFTLSGYILNEGITVTPPTGFEVSTSAGTGFASSIVVGVGGTFNATIYVRLRASTIPGSYGGNIVLSSSGVSNVNVSIAASTVNKKALTISSADAQDKEYDKTTVAVITGTLTGVISGDEVTLNGGGTFANANVGNNKAVTSALSLGGAQAAYYTLTQPTGLTANITKKSLIVINAVAADKVYNGNTAVTITGATLSGIISPDVVTLSGGGVFADKNVGTAKPITTSFALGGTNAGNYSIIQPSLTASITAKNLTITSAAAQNRAYNRTNVATITGTLSGVVSGDVVAHSGIGTFPNANIGTAKPVTPTLTLTGAAAGNYTLTQPSTLAANITAKALTITGADALNKEYDGTNVAIITGTLTGVVSPDDVSFVGTGTFNNAAVGNNKNVTTAVTLAGTQISNYTITQPTGITANITKKNLQVVGLTANDKTYNRTTAVSVTGTAALSGIVGTEIVNLGGTPTMVFATAAAGTNKAITITGYSISGTNAGNYNIVQPSLTADIFPKALNLSGSFAANSKTYDGTTNATASGTATLAAGGVISPDAVTLSGSSTGTFLTASAGTNKTVQITGHTLTGAQAANYSIARPTVTANITPKNLTVTGAAAQNKAFDGNNNAVITGAALVGVVSPDVVTVSGGGTFSSSVVGTGIAVTANLTLGGSDAGNYALTQPTGLMANIIASVPTTTTWNGSIWDNGAPTASINAITNSNYNTTTNGNITANNLTINNGDTLFVASTGAITTTSGITNNGVLLSCGGIIIGAVTGNTVVTASSPSIGTQPQAQTVCVGTNLTLSVAATGSGLSYQWKKGAASVGTNANSLNLSNVSVSDAGNYSVVITGMCGNTTSNAVAVNINETTSISIQPQPQIVTEGANVTLTVAATGTNLNYQWKKGAANVGINSSSLVLNNVSVSDAGNYSVVITGDCGNATSDVAALTVNAACIVPSIGTQPQMQTVTEGANVTFSVAATGTNLSYQWKKGSTNIDTNSNTLTLSNVALADAGSYSVVVTGDCGNVTSSAAALTVNAAAVTCDNLSFTIVSIGASVVDISWPLQVGMIGYEVQWKTATDFWDGPGRFSASVTSYRIPSLIPNTTYNLRFRSVNSNGLYNLWENCTVTTAPLFSCNAPTVTVNIGASVADISWLGESNTAGYEVQWQTGTSAWTGPGKFATSVTSYRIPNLLPSTTYNYRVRSLCTPLNEWTLWTTSSFTTAATFNCNAPTLTITNIGATIADVSWGLESNAATYEIQWQIVGSFWTVPSRFVGNVASYRIPDLLPNTAYDYRVRSLCSPVNEWTLWITGDFTTKSSTNCSSPIVSDTATATAIDLSWTATDSTNAYEIQWQSVGGLWNGSGRINNPLLASFRIPNLLASTTYNYRVRSRCMPTNEWAAWSTGNITTSLGGARLGVNALSIHIYPNPSSGLVNISGVVEAMYYVYNAMGQMVSSGEISNEIATVNLSNQANGIYLLKVVSSGAVQTKQVIINR